MLHFSENYSNFANDSVRGSAVLSACKRWSGPVGAVRGPCARCVSDSAVGAQQRSGSDSDESLYWMAALVLSCPKELCDFFSVSVYPFSWLFTRVKLKVGTMTSCYCAICEY